MRGEAGEREPEDGHDERADDWTESHWKLLSGSFSLWEFRTFRGSGAFLPLIPGRARVRVPSHFIPRRLLRSAPSHDPCPGTAALAKALIPHGFFPVRGPRREARLSSFSVSSFQAK